MTQLRKLDIKAQDSFSIDAFGRWRVSNPQTIFDSKQLYGNAAFFFDDQETSGADTGSSHSTLTASTAISVAETTAGTRVRQSKMRFNYEPGKSQLILVTCAEFDSSTGITKRFGYFDTYNGLFFESDEGTYRVVRRTNASGSVVDNSVDQSSWNLDTMDGSGTSGVTLDFTKTQIGFIDFEWLGVGRVRMGWVVDGKIYYCHEFLNANNLDTVYMSTPNLPIRYEISNDGNGAADSFHHICCSIMSEGGQENLGTINSVNTGSTKFDLATAGTSYAILAMRLKSTHLSATIKLLNATVMEYAGAACLVEIKLNPTLSDTFSYSAVQYSGIEYATSNATITATAGVTLYSDYLVSTKQSQKAISTQVPSAYSLGSTIDGTSDVIAVCVTPIDANADVFAALSFRSLL